MKDKPTPAAPPKPIPKPEGKPTDPIQPPPTQKRLIIIEFDSAKAMVVKSDCASVFEFKAILHALLASMERG